MAIDAIHVGDICSFTSSLAWPETEPLGQPGERRGGDAVHGDAVAGQLVGGDDRERGDPGLGRAVVGLADVAVDARRRRGVDEAGVDVLAGLRPVTPVGGGEVRRAGGALQVHLDDGVPLGLAHVGQHAVAQDAGVVDQHVEAAVGVDGLGDDALGAAPVADVVGVGHRLAAGGDDLVDDLLRPVRRRSPCRRRCHRCRSRRPWRRGRPASARARGRCPGRHRSRCRCGPRRVGPSRCSPWSHGVEDRSWHDPPGELPFPTYQSVDCAGAPRRDRPRPRRRPRRALCRRSPVRRRRGRRHHSRDPQGLVEAGDRRHPARGLREPHLEGAGVLRSRPRPLRAGGRGPRPRRQPLRRRRPLGAVRHGHLGPLHRRPRRRPRRAVPEQAAQPDRGHRRHAPVAGTSTRAGCSATTGSTTPTPCARASTSSGTPTPPSSTPRCPPWARPATASSGRGSAPAPTTCARSGGTR